MKYKCPKCGGPQPADMTKECPCLSRPAPGYAGPSSWETLEYAGETRIFWIAPYMTRDIAELTLSADRTELKFTQWLAGGKGIYCPVAIDQDPPPLGGRTTHSLLAGSSLKLIDRNGTANIPFDLDQLICANPRFTLVEPP